MADDVPAVAAEYAGMQVGSGTGAQGSDDAVPYGPPNPFEASPDQPGSYGPPKDVFTGSTSGGGSSASGGGIDLSGLVKSAGDAAGSVIKSLGNLTTPPTPKIPTPPAPPNLPTSLPLPPAPPGQSGPPAPAPTANNQPAAGGPGAGMQAAPKLSKGAKIAIGVGIGGMVVGGGLLVASAVGRKGKK